jgi:predicted nucleic acid-binding protein
MPEARKLLNQFANDRKAEQISDDLPALDSHSRKSEEVMDLYLASLAARHGAKLATFDQAITHPAVELIS